MITNCLNIDNLAKRTGLTRRTIRYYVARGLLKPPEGGGRGHYYTGEHLEQIERINLWRSQGVPLDMIRELIAKGETPRIPDVKPSAGASAKKGSGKTAHPEKETWKRYMLLPGVELSIRAGTLDESACEKICGEIIKTVQGGARKKVRK